LKKILQIIPSFNKSWGGPVRMVDDLSSYIIKEQIGSVDILCSNVFGDYSKTENEKISVHQFNTSIFNKIWIGHSIEFKKFIADNILNYDVIHIHEMWHYLHFFSIKLARTHNIPYVITPHGGLEERRLKNIKKKIFFNLIEKNICNNAKYIHALTKYEEEDILSLCPDAKTQVIPNGVGKALKAKEAFKIKNELKINKSSKIILFLGRLHKDKGLDLLIRAFKKIEDRDWILIIAGPDEHGYRQKYKNIKNTIFTGLVDGNIKASLYEVSDVFILPSYGEGFSMSLLEAMSYKKPLIISKFCYFSDIEKHKAGLIIELNENEIIKSLYKILDDDNLKNEMSNNSFQLVKKKYDNKFIFKKITELYSK
tara:strand:+ start:9605 stop:10708 length:1104 start_codon:yes stop_codon:yes gene_type:complete